MYGIPNMKLDKSVIERRRKLMEEEGVVFKTGVDVGNGASFEKITEEFDAVALCCGSKKARTITAKGSEDCKDMHLICTWQLISLSPLQRTSSQEKPESGR